AQGVEGFAGHGGVVGARRAAGGEQRVDLVRQLLAGDVAEVEVVDRNAGHAQAAPGGGAGKLGGQGGLAAALRAGDAVDARAVVEHVVEHALHEPAVEGVGVARVQGRLHAATTAQ